MAKHAALLGCLQCTYLACSPERLSDVKNFSHRIADTFERYNRRMKRHPLGADAARPRGPSETSRLALDSAAASLMRTSSRADRMPSKFLERIPEHAASLEALSSQDIMQGELAARCFGITSLYMSPCCTDLCLSRCSSGTSILLIIS